MKNLCQLRLNIRLVNRQIVNDFGSSLSQLSRQGTKFDHILSRTSVCSAKFNRTKIVLWQSKSIFSDVSFWTILLFSPTKNRLSRNHPRILKHLQLPGIWNHLTNRTFVNKGHKRNRDSLVERKVPNRKLNDCTFYFEVLHNRSEDVWVSPSQHYRNGNTDLGLFRDKIFVWIASFQGKRARDHFCCGFFPFAKMGHLNHRLSDSL